MMFSPSAVARTTHHSSSSRAFLKRWRRRQSHGGGSPLVALWLALGLAVGGALGGCSGSKKAVKGPTGAPTVADLRKTSDSGRPVWVERGSAAITTGGDERVFYGVGEASNIQNPALLRSASDGRARSALGQVFETYSAALMQDFMDSTGTQEVSEATRTLSEVSLEGSDIVDRYVDETGAMWSLAVLRLDSVQKAIAKAKKMGAMRKHATPELMAELFDRESARLGTSAPDSRPTLEGVRPTRSAMDALDGDAPPRVGMQSGSDGLSADDERVMAELAAMGAGRREGGDGDDGAGGDGSPVTVSKLEGQPAWAVGPSKAYPRRKFLCGVGVGSVRVMAENAAFAAIGRVFVARVKAVSDDFVGAYSKTGAADLEVQSVEQRTRVSTEQILRGVELRELAQDENDTYYALACLLRDSAAGALRASIRDADKQVKRLLGKAKRQGKAKRVATLAKALDALLQREAWNGELRILDADGIGLPGPYAQMDVAAALDDAVQALRVEVQVSGEHQKAVRRALMEGLSKRGYQVTAVAAKDDAADEDQAEGGGETGANDGGEAASETRGDVLVLANMVMEVTPGPKLRGKPTKLARGVLSVEVKNLATDQVLGAFEERRKEGHRNAAAAERKVVRKLARKLTNQVGAKLAAALGE